MIFFFFTWFWFLFEFLSKISRYYFWSSFFLHLWNFLIFIEDLVGVLFTSTLFKTFNFFVGWGWIFHLWPQILDLIKLFNMIGVCFQHVLVFSLLITKKKYFKLLKMNKMDEHRPRLRPRVRRNWNITWPSWPRTWSKLS